MLGEVIVSSKGGIKSISGQQKLQMDVSILNIGILSHVTLTLGQFSTSCIFYAAPILATIHGQFTDNLSISHKSFSHPYMVSCDVVRLGQFTRYNPRKRHDLISELMTKWVRSVVYIARIL